MLNEISYIKLCILSHCPLGTKSSKTYILNHSKHILNHMNKLKSKIIFYPLI